MLHNKVVLITGSASELGQAVALHCAREGSSLLLADRDTAGARATAEQAITFGARVLVVSGEVSRPGDMQHLVERCCAHFGRLDIACNHTVDGSTTGTATPLVARSTGESGIDGAVIGMFYGMRYQIEAMRRSAGGVVINVAWTRDAPPSEDADGNQRMLAQRQVANLTRRLAHEHASKGIRIHTLTGAAPKDTKAASAAAQTMAEWVGWLLTERSGWINGAMYGIDQGRPTPRALATASLLGR